MCKDICGDGLIMANPCDSLPSVLDDGCNSQCQIEPYFTCNYTSVNHTTPNGTIIQPNKSSCYYHGPITISVVDAQQQLFSNTLQLSFQIQPYLSGMPLSSDPLTYLQSIFSLSSTAAIQINDISVDQTTGIVTFLVGYS